MIDDIRKFQRAVSGLKKEIKALRGVYPMLRVCIQAYDIPELTKLIFPSPNIILLRVNKTFWDNNINDIIHIFNELYYFYWRKCRTYITYILPLAPRIGKGASIYFENYGFILKELE